MKKQRTLWRASEIDKLIDKREEFRDRYARYRYGARKQGDMFRRSQEADHLLEMALEVIDALSDTMPELTRILDGATEVLANPANNNTRWSAEEDEHLIELACAGESPVKMAATFYRSPAAVATRISQLVGVKRLFINVNGRFVGTLDEVVEVDTHVDGRLYRDAVQ
jgi:hypothetical protein